MLIENNSVNQLGVPSAQQMMTKHGCQIVFDFSFFENMATLSNCSFAQQLYAPSND